jgi:2-keto-4-pentenoate hydratase/2-oxohepta-3-ene-1,7-dioic acid hydratase in catechol pathway
MRLVRHGARGAERPGLVDAQGVLRDLSAHIPDLGGSALLPDSLERLRALDPASLPPVPGTPRKAPCVAGTGKFICIGLNYSDHAAEANMTVPPEPIVFMKATSAICGSDDDIEMPLGGVKLDWEAELAVVIGMPAKYVTEKNALDHIAGYCVTNDVSERSFQMEHQGQWTKGKSHDTFGPIGPWLVTADEVADPQRLAIWLSVNGRRYQNGTTANMVYGVRYLVSYLSRFMTLHPGDIIATGTPAGVGLGQKPPMFLKAGDIVELGIEGLGTQRQCIIAPHASGAA